MIRYEDDDVVIGLERSTKLLLPEVKQPLSKLSVKLSASFLRSSIINNDVEHSFSSRIIDDDDELEQRSVSDQIFN